jgi:gamma-glutamylcyclotransferase (GGCT)/AIG2-like uncharacterized protein YtfP
MYHLLARYGRFVDDATYQGKLYMLDYYPGVVPSDNRQDIVHGEVYKLVAQKFVLLKLDDYEVCGPKFPEPNEYVRRKEKVTLKSGKIVFAWIYLF